MNQKQNSSNQQKTPFHSSKSSFKEIIENIEIYNLKQDQVIKKELSNKSKLKSLWLDRIKIIPPQLSPAERQKLFRSPDTFSTKEFDVFKCFKHYHTTKEMFDADDELLFQKRTILFGQSVKQLKPKGDIQGHSQNSSFEIPKCQVIGLRVKKLKQNWKLAYRRDEINILKFSSVTPKYVNQIKYAEIKNLFLSTGKTENKKMLKKTIPFEQQLFKENLFDRPAQKTPDKNSPKKFRRNINKMKTNFIIKKPF